MDKSVNERIKALLKAENISLTSYGTNLKEMSLSKFARQLSGENAMTADVIIAIMRDFPLVSAEWLLFGRGNMYVSDNLPAISGTENEETMNLHAEIAKLTVERDAALEKIADKNREIGDLREMLEDKRDRIRLLLSEIEMLKDKMTIDEEKEKKVV